jgi:hypothetical protein
MRLKAVFTLALDPAAGAVADELLRAALADATGRGSASIALRVATTLGDPPAIRAALAAVEGGADTADVRAAHQLLSNQALEAEEVP